MKSIYTNFSSIGYIRDVSQPFFCKESIVYNSFVQPNPIQFLGKPDRVDTLFLGSIRSGWALRMEKRVRLGRVDIKKGQNSDLT